MKKVIFIIVPSCSSDDWLNAKMMQITKACIYCLNGYVYDVVVVDSYDEINHYLDKADLLVVSTAGNVIIERDHIWNKIHSISDTIGLMGHILQFEGEPTPYLHEQFFIINTHAFDYLNFDACQKIGPKLIRSKEDMHDGHAPLYITLDNNLVPWEGKFGTQIIADCLLNGYEVRNFDHDWRYPNLADNYLRVDRVKHLPSRGYCYPLLNTELFSKSLRELRLYPGLDESQELLIQSVLEISKFKILNIWHYESTSTVSLAESVICPATGFLAELTAYKSQSKKIIFYDKNPNNINFKKHLYQNWNGIDYTAFAISWADDNGLTPEPMFAADKARASTLISETESKIFLNWNTWKQSVDVDFIVCDLISDINILLDNVSNNSILNTSTILGIYPLTAMIYDTEELELVKNKIRDKMTKTNSVWIDS